MEGREDRMAVVKALILTSMPFVASEAATGVISFLTGELSIPPVVGVGMAVDFTILILGLVVLVARTMKKKTGTEEAPARSARAGRRSKRSCTSAAESAARCSMWRG